MPNIESLEPVMILSPHLDDAVFSCANLLISHPSATVVTIFAGAPEVIHKGYNSETTHKNFAPEAIKVRRDEDLDALSFVKSTPVWLDLFDSDYEKYRFSTNYVEVIQSEIAGVLDQARPRSVFAPLGLIHRDHLAVSEACRALLTNTIVNWYLYMDLPYGLASRRTVAKRLRTFRRSTALIQMDSYEAPLGAKNDAMSLYRSQYEPTRRNYGKYFDATTLGAERYWRVAPRP